MHILQRIWRQFKALQHYQNISVFITRRKKNISENFVSMQENINPGKFLGRINVQILLAFTRVFQIWSGYLINTLMAN